MDGRQIISLVLGTTLSGCSPQAQLSDMPLQERLKALADRDEPKCHEASLGVMCYAPMPTLLTANYLCPTCSNKTVYNHRADASNNIVSTVKYIQQYRDDMKKLAPLARDNGYQLQLDEAGLCPHCSKGKSAVIALIAIDANGKETRTAPLSLSDYKYLTSFFLGRNYYPDSMADKEEFPFLQQLLHGYCGYPLKKHAPRIAQLLGLELKEKEPSKK